MKIALIGYGRMGHMIEEIAVSRGHEIVCTVDVGNPEAFDSEAFRSADVRLFQCQESLCRRPQGRERHDRMVRGSP